MAFTLFSCEICFAAIYAVLSRNLFCRSLRTFCVETTYGQNVVRGEKMTNIMYDYNSLALPKTPQHPLKSQKCKTCPKMAKNGKKCKNPKNVQMRIDPYSSPMMLMIIFDGKIGPKTGENSHIWRG